MLNRERIMSKALFFYTIDEFQDELKYCKRKGLKPYKYKQRTLNGQPFDVVATQYKKIIIFMMF